MQELENCKTRFNYFVIDKLNCYYILYSQTNNKAPVSGHCHPQNIVQKTFS